MKKNDICIACNVAIDGAKTPTLRRETVVETVDDVSGLRKIALSRRHAVVITSVTIDGETLAGSGYSVNTESGVLSRLGGALWSGTVVVTYVAGFATVPADLFGIALDMARAGVRSNCIAPFAWSRMTASIPAETPEQKERVERLKTMSADKIAPLVVYLASDASKDVTNQIFSVRKNEIVLYNKPRPVRSMTKLEGWTPEAIAAELIPAFKPSFARADEVSAHVFPYDPI